MSLNKLSNTAFQFQDAGSPQASSNTNDFLHILLHLQYRIQQMIWGAQGAYDKGIHKIINA